ncbi:hypothetical protein MLD38_031307 [Melastoma candidum]|uniref:Uncharacterized protein n=1 Tax=Melastoma candidum TaxID=119954 RepID=A0ACB9MPB0_9MYRT|nr:hypothetical protein MLD38_031307 [Melastoma candidum]
MGRGRRGRACVVVLGDFGRSPRMQYHALSLARQASLEVVVVAYGGSVPHKEILDLESIYIHEMVPTPDAFIVQNTPSVPTLVAARWASRLRHSAFLIDWHNFGYTLLALSLGRLSPFLALYHWIEKHYGKMADGSFCVTKAMQHGLAQNWGIKATVLYDQPPEFFHPASLEEKHQLFCRLSKDINTSLGVEDCTSHGGAEPALIVSSTSWTSDEDFGILLEAAVMYNRRVAAILNEDDSSDRMLLWKEIHDGKKHLYPSLLFVITGIRQKMKGEVLLVYCCQYFCLRDALLQEKDLRRKRSADLGVCLHTSSSGLDLPMKVVDMFGSGLPVCAVSYSCIEELVKVNKNGLLFSSSSELADELLMLFKGFPSDCNALKSLRDGAHETGASARWATEWEEHAKPPLLDVISRKFD